MGGAWGYFSGSKRPDRVHMNLPPCPYMRSANFMSLSGFILGPGRHGDGSMLPYISIAPSSFHPSQKPVLGNSTPRPAACRRVILFEGQNARFRVIFPAIARGSFFLIFALILDIAHSQTHSSHLNARFLTILNAAYKVDNIFYSFAARTTKAVTIARIVVFAVINGETVAFFRRHPMAKIYMKSTFY
jgi:hypothetical protein